MKSMMLQRAALSNKTKLRTVDSLEGRKSL